MQDHYTGDKVLDSILLELRDERKIKQLRGVTIRGIWTQYEYRDVGNHIKALRNYIITNYSKCSRNTVEEKKKLLLFIDEVNRRLDIICRYFNDDE